MVMGMTRVDEVAYIIVGVGELRFTTTSDGNGELIIEWFGVRDFQQVRVFSSLVQLRSSPVQGRV